MKKIVLVLLLCSVTFAKDEIATFAGGCFWCVEANFEKVPGVKTVVSGYTGGKKLNPTYEEVGSGSTGHTEAVQVTYDPKVVSYEKLIEVLWRTIDPTDAGGSFVDRGSQYRPGIFYHNEKQRTIAEGAKQTLQDSKKFSKPIVVEIVKLVKFYPAEDYHQDYYKKSPESYQRYRSGSGRDQFIEKTWGKEVKL